MQQELHIKIYRDGEYSMKDNIEFKLQTIVRSKLPVVINNINNFFEQPL